MHHLISRISPRQQQVGIATIRDAEGHCAVADFTHGDTACNMIHDARSKDHRTLICIVGLREATMVQTDDATLVAHKSQLQKIKELVKGPDADSNRKRWCDPDVRRPDRGFAGSGFSTRSNRTDANS
jgi:hypothetical protein